MTKIPGYLFSFGLASLVIIGYWGYRNGTAHERLFHDYFDVVPHTDFSQHRALFPTNSNANLQARKQAVRYQLEGQFDFAFEAWRAHFEHYGDSDQLGLLYAANNAMAYGYPEQANWYLNKINLEASSIRFSQEVIWYKALLLLLTNEVAKSKALLQTINTKEATPAIRRQLPELLLRIETI